MKRLAVALIAILWSISFPAFAHGIGGRQDLPVPVSVFVTAAIVVLVISFVVLAVAWPHPRFQEPVQPSPVFGGWTKHISRLLSAVGLGAFLVVIIAGLKGVDNSSKNPASVLVFVDWWLVVPFLAVVVNLYPVINPWRFLLGWFGVEDRPNGRGYEPAALALLAFTWLELVSPRQGPRVLALAAVVYLVYLTVVGYVHGRSAVYESFDGFSVYSGLFGVMAPLVTRDDGTWYRQPPFRGLAALPERSGLDLVAVVMIGTVTYDGAKSTAWWAESIVSPLASVLTAVPVPLSSALVGSVGLLGSVGLVMIGYRAACLLAVRLARSEFSVQAVANRFAHTLIPIGFAYAFAHYFTLVLFEGQLLLSTMSDPFGLGWDIFGTAGRPVDYSLITGTSSWVWYVQVAVIVVGHLGGVVLAHDRALVDFRGPNAVRSQYAMLALMVLLTGLGLTLLSAS